VLADLLGVRGFERKVAGLAQINLVQQGGELAYLIRHDPDFRGVRREHLIEAGRRVRLKAAIPALHACLKRGLGGSRFEFFVISAAPREVVISALEGVVAADHIYGTEFDYDPGTGEVRAITRVPAGYGKVTVLDELSLRLEIVTDRIIYVGDGVSDIHVMLHVNNGQGFTIAASENRQLARIARTTVLSDNACSILVPVLDQVLGMRTPEIRALFEAQGLRLHDWERARTDRVLIREDPIAPEPA
jgi:phosphoserine phosphatase